MERSLKNENWRSDRASNRAWWSRRLRSAGLGALALSSVLAPLASLAQQPYAPASLQQPAAAPAVVAPASLMPVTASYQGPVDPSVPPATPGGGGAVPALAPPVVKASCAVVMDATTGQVIWGKNPHLKRPNASTTKIMTATLVLESNRLDDRVTFSEYARHTDYGNLNAKPGEVFKMKDLLYAILLRSSNDSCVAVAEHLDGSPWRFAQRMTAKAKEVGALNTNFVTTNGLYDKNHYSTAYDLALMARYAMRYPLFNEVVATKSKVISRSINWKDTLIKNHNKFLGKYSGADGVKTGYVRQSGKCLVASATRMEGERPWRLITVVLNSPDTYGDSQRMMDWTRKYFQPLYFAHKGEQVEMASVSGGVHARVPLMVADDLHLIVRREAAPRAEREIRSRALQAPVLDQQVAGTLAALVDGKSLGEVNLVAGAPVERTWTSAGVTPMAGWGLGIFLSLVGLRYAGTITKSARRRRRRVPAGSRGSDLQRES